MDFGNFMVFSETNKKCLPQKLSSESGTLVCVRRSAENIIPRAVTAVSKSLRGFVPYLQMNHTSGRFENLDIFGFFSAVKNSFYLKPAVRIVKELIVPIPWKVQLTMIGR